MVGIERHVVDEVESPVWKFIVVKSVDGSGLHGREGRQKIRSTTFREFSVKYSLGAEVVVPCTCSFKEVWSKQDSNKCMTWLERCDVR